MEKKTTEKTVCEGLKKIEEDVVIGYKKLENGAVEGFNKVNDKMIEKLFAKEGESVEDAIKRLSGESDESEKDEK